MDHWGEPIRTTFTCAADQVFNVDAYTPGDFRKFFDDPRTRADYLEWAPILLEAEEYHAGNREVAEPVPPKKSEGGSQKGRLAYQRRKLAKSLMNQRVRLLKRLRTRGGTEYPKGSIWEVVENDGGGRFTISRVDTEVGGVVTHVDHTNFELVSQGSES